MPKTVTLRLTDSTYRLFRRLAEDQNRTLSNFIETSALRQIEVEESVDEFEMAEIRANQSLNRSLKRGLADAAKKDGAFVG
jgi:predicted transcriptional regulator